MCRGISGIFLCSWQTKSDGAHGFLQWIPFTIHSQPIERMGSTDIETWVR